jgi:branched-chain amino acid transport system ATP-binding protein
VFLRHRTRLRNNKENAMTEFLVTNGLTKRFGGLTAVNGIDIDVTSGEVVGVIGPNGSGKTTLFNLLSGFFPPSAGGVIFQGADITRLPAHKRAQKGIVRTFQLVSVFDSLTVWQNLVLSSTRRLAWHNSVRRFFFTRATNSLIYDNCRLALHEVGLEDLADHPTSSLSYGDKRMLEIAIGLSLQPKLFLLDEPFSGLSDHEIGLVLELLFRVKDNFTLVIIEHKISKILDLVKRLCVMNYGRLICQGEPREVLSQPEVTECYWGTENPFYSA